MPSDLQVNLMTARILISAGDFKINVGRHSLLSIKMWNTTTIRCGRGEADFAMPNWRSWPPTLHTAGWQASTVFTHGERTESFASTRGRGGSSWPPRPGGAAPRLSQTLLIPHFPRSTFPLKKQPGVTSESAGQARQRLRSYSQALLPNPAWGCSRAHCSQCKSQIQLF